MRLNDRCSSLARHTCFVSGARLELVKWPAAVSLRSADFRLLGSLLLRSALGILGLRIRETNSFVFSLSLNTTFFEPLCVVSILSVFFQL